MFSANENITLRKHKKQIVEWVEETIDTSILDLGINVMVMEVKCTLPGCVPVETVIIIIFPKLVPDNELIIGLKESAGGNYKTKILLPMSQVTKNDVLLSLPKLYFIGGLYTIENVYTNVRNNMIGQITQLLTEDNDNNDIVSKTKLAQFLQLSLQEYINNNCTIPENWSTENPIMPTTIISNNILQDNVQSFISSNKNNDNNNTVNSSNGKNTTTKTTDDVITKILPSIGNIDILKDSNENDNSKINESSMN